MNMVLDRDVLIVFVQLLMAVVVCGTAIFLAYVYVKTELERARKRAQARAKAAQSLSNE